MILGRQRLRAPRRAAEATRNDDLAWQFRTIEQGIIKDIDDMAPQIANHLRNTDAAYWQIFVPRFGPKALPRRISEKNAEDIVDSIIRPTSAPNRVETIKRAWEVIKHPAERERVAGAWWRGLVDTSLENGQFSKERFLRNLDRYADPKTGDAVLPTALGKQYGKVKSLVGEMRVVQPKSTDGVIAQTIEQSQKNVQREIGRIKGVGAREVTELQRTAQKEVAEIERRTAKQRAALEKEIVEEVEKITGRPFAEHTGQWLGQLQILQGAIQTASGHPFGLRRIAQGGLILTGGSTVAKMLNSVKGLELITRAQRATPGTLQAVANATAIQSFVRETRRRERISVSHPDTLA